MNRILRLLLVCCFFSVLSCNTIKKEYILPSNPYGVYAVIYNCKNGIKVSEGNIVRYDFKKSNMLFVKNSILYGAVDFSFFKFDDLNNNYEVVPIEQHVDKKTGSDTVIKILTTKSYCLAINDSQQACVDYEMFIVDEQKNVIPDIEINQFENNLTNLLDSFIVNKLVDYNVKRIIDTK